MASALAGKTCTPCRGGVPPLTPEEAEGYRAQAPDWSLMDEATRIERRLRFKDFREAFAFVARAAELAEAEGHHPDISIRLGLRDGVAADQEDQRACTRTTSSCATRVVDAGLGVTPLARGGRSGHDGRPANLDGCRPDLREVCLPKPFGPPRQAVVVLDPRHHPRGKMANRREEARLT